MLSIRFRRRSPVSRKRRESGRFQPRGRWCDGAGSDGSRRCGCLMYLRLNLESSGPDFFTATPGCHGIGAAAHCTCAVEDSHAAGGRVDPRRWRRRDRTARTDAVCGVPRRGCDAGGPAAAGSGGRRSDRGVEPAQLPARRPPAAPGPRVLAAHEHLRFRGRAGGSGRRCVDPERDQRHPPVPTDPASRGTIGCSSCSTSRSCSMGWRFPTARGRVWR